MTGQVLKLGDIVPNFQADSSIGNIDFHGWLGNRSEQYFLSSLLFRIASYVRHKRLVYGTQLYSCIVILVEGYLELL